MPNNPVQIVLNDESYIRAPEPGRAGPDKDFFDGNDRGFAAHKAAMIERLEGIDAELAESRFGPLAYVRVKMRTEAIAKSYRPNKFLFVRDQFPCVGAGAPGELFFRLPRHYIHRLRTRFDSAELQGEDRVSRNGQPYRFVSRARSELGAIEEIDIAPIAGKRNFSAAQAVQALLQPSAASGYVVELFEQRPLDPTLSDDVLGLRQSFETLQREIGALGQGMYAALLPSPGGVPSLEVLVTNSRNLPLIEDRRAIKGDLTLEPGVASVDPSVERHEEVLNVLAKHPLVRRIRFPVLLEASDA